jgi:hypothetical protein
MHGLSDLRTVGNQQMMTRVQDGPQHHALAHDAQVHEPVHSNRCLTVWEIAEGCNISI